MVKNSIKYLWIVSIVKENNFERLFQRSFVNREKDDDLLLGFFSSIMEFAKKIAQDDLENIEMKDSLVFYKFADEFFIVIVTEKDVNKKKINKLLLNIKNSFENQYHGLFDTKNKDIFQHFNESIDIMLDNL
ncbi:MAG: hypothetical protein GF329_04750 [Candidatus Lokiarchaeota archaeon]|nr:hypothetical protein [Candidatus Lokiarchaeota archaeon]